VARPEGRANARLFPRRGRGRPPLLAVPAGSLRHNAGFAALVPARAVRMSTAGPPAYAEFAVQSNFSFLRAASRPEELVITARLYKYKAMGLADRNTVAGVVRAWSKAKVEGLDFHPGCRLVFSNSGPDVLAYPRDRAG